jgi:hypothetical protein
MAEHEHKWEGITEHVERCECGKSRLAPVPGLYDGEYSDELRGRWLAKAARLVLVVEGPGSRDGTVAAHAEHDPDNRQDDLPIVTLRARYVGLRDG